MVGRTLNHYRIEAKMGSGGMGDVYRATDTQLRREVAIKVLSRSLVQDPEYLQRFRREARLLASLNHPNIATIYGLEEMQDETFLAMELVPGPTLHEVIGGKRPNVTRAVDIGRQIGAALQAAHEKGVVHRDLKPSNIKITPNGTVKVLDFGLAKSVRSREAGQNFNDASTIAPTVTADGLALGTPGYMSPEQLHGENVDRRSDIWAYGCVVYELLSGQPAFGGESMSERLRASLTREPDWTRLPADTPTALRKLLRRCLAKEVPRRYQDFGDLLLDLEDVFIDEAPARHGPRWPGALAVLATALALVAGLYFLWMSSPEPQQWSGELLGGPGRAMGPRISPDGETLAFQVWSNDTQNQVAVLKPASGHWSVLTSEKADGPIMDLSWSKDGTRIYYDRYGKGIFSIPAVGGESRLVVENGLGPQAIADGACCLPV
jgi:hypothetical protein